MIGLLRLVLFGFIGLTILFLLIELYARSLTRERLEKRWDAEGTGDKAARDTFLRQGMERYRHSLRAKLIWGVYGVPIAGIVILIYVLNFS